MNPEELFARAVTLLPGAVRERLDGDFPMDWSILEDAGTSADLGEAVRVRRRLPEPVETLVHRLIRDVGIVPSDLVADLERQGAADAWIHWVTIEGRGESYLLRNDRTGDIHTDIRPEAVAGYAALGMELATDVHESVQRWLEAGRNHRETVDDERSPLARCAVRMHGHLQARSGTRSEPPTTVSLARTLEFAWNTQGVEVRAALSGIRLSTGRGARAPSGNHFAPVTGFRLHACDAGEIRWLRTLAERAAAGSPASMAGAGPEAAGQPAEAREHAAGDQAPQPDADTLELGSAPEGLVPDAEVTEIERTVSEVPSAVRARMGETHGIAVVEMLERFRNPQVVDALRRDVGAAESGGQARIPRWLERLAAALLMDTGAQTREGLRTASMRLDSQPQSNGEYRGIESGTAATGHLTAAGLLQQLHLSLAFARDAWVGLTALQSAGKEGNWALNEAVTASPLSTNDREILEAARDLGRALDRIRQSHAGAHGQRPPSTLERAAMVAEALKTVGPTIRTTVGWPGTAHTPSSRDPEDVARMATVAEGLHAEIRRVANQMIAGRVAEVPPYGESRGA